MSMGMMMMPPVVISTPFKILLFVLVDGWYLIARALSASFGS
jgi:flagellar biosynthetic protein FliP